MIEGVHPGGVGKILKHIGGECPVGMGGSPLHRERINKIGYTLGGASPMLTPLWETLIIWIEPKKFQSTKNSRKKTVLDLSQEFQVTYINSKGRNCSDSYNSINGSQTLLVILTVFP